jgi:hypothetical protein
VILATNELAISAAAIFAHRCAAELPAADYQV